MIRDKQKAGRFCVLALAGGNSPRNVYSALVRMHKEEGLSFRNVVVFNLYEYYQLDNAGVLAVGFRRCEQQPQFFKGNAARPRRH